MLDMKPDIYCLTFLNLLLTNNPKIHRELVLKSFLAFIVQIILCVLVYGETKGWNDIFTGSSELNGVRLVCSFLLHISIMPEIKNSLEMLRYTINNPKNFKTHGYYISFLILLMRLFGNFFTELLNVWKMGQSSAVEDIVKDFIAFGIISEIDDLVASSIMNTKVEDELEDNKIPYPKVQDDKYLSEILQQIWHQDDCSKVHRFVQVAFLGIYAVWQLFYVMIYFYFFPFVIILLIFIFGDDQLVQS
jgi:hypothetical protein